MSKVVWGLLLGAALGVFDGLTAWFTPEVRSELFGIVVGSSFKGVLTGVAAGLFARKMKSVAGGIGFGLVVGALLSYGVAAMQGKYYVEIMLPGSILGMVVGFATQRLGEPKVA
jgi:hypothetical protein